MEQKFKKSDGGIDLRALREFCRKEGKVVEYRKASSWSARAKNSFGAQE